MSGVRLARSRARPRKPLHEMSLSGLRRWECAWCGQSCARLRQDPSNCGAIFDRPKPGEVCRMAERVNVRDDAWYRRPSETTPAGPEVAG